MNIFTNKSIWKKIAIILVIVMLFQFVVSNTILAADNEDGDVLEGGGKLLKPIFSLLVTVGDAAVKVMHSMILDVDQTLIDVDTKNPLWQRIVAGLGALFTLGVMRNVQATYNVLDKLGLDKQKEKLLEGTSFMTKLVGGLANKSAVISFYNKEMLPKKLYLPIYTYTPEEIFKGKILLFNVNFFKEPYEIKEELDENGNTKRWYYVDEDGNEVTTSPQDSAAILQKTISKWYNALRNICLVVMLSVLVYIGIRMLLSSIANDKAKYKTMLKDWLVGLCLLFLMHYIMAFSVTLVEKLTDIVAVSIDEQYYFVGLPYMDTLEEELKEIGKEEDYRINKDNKNEGYAWPCNLMGYLRLTAQMNTNSWQYIGMAIMFIMLVLFTIMFTFTYLKRLLYMAFLTLISPMVALTYCIDKLNDGQAQGFNKWLKEYIFNLLIQPMHLLLYYILVSSAFDFMGENVIYSIVALGFMTKAEKLLRSLFGFEKAQTPSAMGTAGALAAGSALQSLLHKRPSKGKGGEGSAENDADIGKLPTVGDDYNPINQFSDDATNSNQMITTPNNILSANEKALSPGENVDNVNDNTQNSEKILLSPETKMAIAQQQAEEEARRKAEQEQMRLAQKNEEENAKKMTLPKRVLRPIKRELHAQRIAKTAAVKSLPGKFTRKVKNSHPIRMAGKVAAGAAVGTLAGGAGIAIGAATGDFGNVAKIGSGAAVGGFALGSAVTQRAQSLVNNDSVYKDAYNNGEYKEDAKNDYVKNYIKDAENRAYFETRIGKEETKKMFAKRGEVEQYLNNGITDRKEMIALHKLQQQPKEDGGVKNIDEAIAVSQLRGMIGSDTTKMTKKSRQEWQDRLSEMAGKSGVQNKDRFAENRLREIDKLNKLRS